MIVSKEKKIEAKTYYKLAFNDAQYGSTIYVGGPFELAAQV
jgi:hypothetical protein